MKPDDFCELGYTIVRELGRGTTGVVYEAVHSTIGRQVAIKISSDSNSTRAMREAQSHASLRNDHDNIVPLSEVGEHWGQFYLVREYVAGNDLEDYLSGANLEPDWHSESRSGNESGGTGSSRSKTDHRNLVSSNVLISQAGRAKLIGFGRAKHQDEDEQIAKLQIAADISSIGKLIVTAAKPTRRTVARVSRCNLHEMRKSWLGLGLQIGRRIGG